MKDIVGAYPSLNIFFQKQVHFPAQSQMAFVFFAIKSEKELKV